MRTSIDGMIAILKSEAVVLSTYDDGAGVLTIGVGHTAHAGQPHPQPGLKLTLRQALKLFIEDLRKFEARVEKAITRPIDQPAFDGFVSFDFNTGKIIGGSVDDKWNAGNVGAAMKTLKSYNKARGKVMPGLTARRAEEEAMIRHGHYPHPATILVADKAHRGRYSGARHVPVDEIKALLREITAPVARTVEFDAPAPQAEPDAPPERGSTPAVAPAPQSGPGGGGAVAGGIVAGGGAATVAVAAGVDWKLVTMIAGCALALGVIIWLVAKIRRQP